MVCSVDFAVRQLSERNAGGISEKAPEMYVVKAPEEAPIHRWLSIFFVTLVHTGIAGPLVCVWGGGGVQKNGWRIL